MDAPYLTTRQLAEYLQIKERKVYELVSNRALPCVRVTGKWLFPRALIDQWLLAHTEGPSLPPPLTRPPLVAGSHDPLLDWSLTHANTGLAKLFDGSLDGLERFAQRQALLAGLHVRGDNGNYNIDAVEQRLRGDAAVLLRFATRQQGLMVAPGNPQRVRTLTDAAALPFALRQPAAGSYVLLQQLLADANLAPEQLNASAIRYRSETDIASAVADGEAAVGLGIKAVANSYKLDFIPLANEHFDVLFEATDYFDAPIQALVQCMRSDAFAQQAQRLGGYDLTASGQVIYNAGQPTPAAQH